MIIIFPKRTCFLYIFYFYFPNKLLVIVSIIVMVFNLKQISLLLAGHQELMTRVHDLFAQRIWTPSNILHAPLSVPCVGAICPGWWRCTIAISPRTTRDSLFSLCPLSIFLPFPHPARHYIAGCVDQRYKADMEEFFTAIRHLLRDRHSDVQGVRLLTARHFVYWILFNIGETVWGGGPIYCYLPNYCHPKLIYLI